MIKLIPAALVAVAMVAGAAAPSMAASLTASNTSYESFDSSYQLQRLRDAGINAVAVAEDTADTMRATVVLDNGQQAFAFYDQDTLNQIGVKHEGARVLTKLDVRQSAPVFSVNSLTHDDDNFDD